MTEEQKTTQTATNSTEKVAKNVSAETISQETEKNTPKETTSQKIEKNISNEQSPEQTSSENNEQENKEALISQTEKILSAMGYISFFCILPLVLRKDSKLCQEHGKQALIITLIFFLFSWMDWADTPLNILLHLIHIGVAAVGMFYASQGKMFKFPVISDMAKKIDFEK